MRKGFLGVTAHWISVESGRWTLESAVIGFRSILGGHDRENLGRYVVGFTDRAGITGKNFSKASVSHAWFSHTMLIRSFNTAVRRYP